MEAAAFDKFADCVIISTQDQLHKVSVFYPLQTGRLTCRVFNHCVAYTVDCLRSRVFVSLVYVDECLKLQNASVIICMHYTYCPVACFTYAGSRCGIC